MGHLRRTAGWLDDRLGFSNIILPVLRHPVPRSVNWWYILGSSTLVAFIVQVVTGTALAFTYTPTPESANDSLVFISREAFWGNTVRGIHYWGASAMVVLITLHMIRVFLTGSYKFPRELNWLVGVLLLFLTMGMAFTGQLLRWDQDAYWSTVIGVEQAARTPWIGGILGRLFIAGDTIGGDTLTRFFATHVFVLPASIITLVSVHLYLVVHHGISEPPEAGEPVDPATYRQRYAALLKREGVPFWPDAAWRDVVAALAVIGTVLTLAIVVGPKVLGPNADPTVVNLYPRPDWYFLWPFAIFPLTPTPYQSWVIIGGPLLTLIALLAIPFVGKQGERSPKRRPWAVASVGVITIAILTLLQLGTRAPWSPVLDPTPLPAEVVQSLPADAQAGAALMVSEACLSCHMVDGQGGKKGPNLSNVGARLSHDQIVWRILNGASNLMPAYGETLSPDEVEELTAFLEAQKEE